MKVIALANEKGGVGKTTCAIHIAAGLAITGLRVVLVDADSQGHISSFFGLQPEPGLYNLLMRNAGFNEVLRILPQTVYEPQDRPAKGLLGIVPSNVETSFLNSALTDLKVIYKRLQELNEFADVVVFDTSPTPSLLHGAIYVATNGIIYPTELSALSFDSLQNSLAHRQTFDEMKVGLGLGRIETLGVVPTRVRLSTVEHSENLKMLVSTYGDAVWPAMQERIAVQEAAMQKRTLFAFAPNDRATEQAWRMVAYAKRALDAMN